MGLNNYNILDYKDQWLKALSDTIDNYDDCIESKIAYDSDAEKCPLCILEDALEDIFQSNIICGHCIHMSIFSQSKICSKQTSFNSVIAYHTFHESLLKLMLIRRRYIVRIYNKLKNS